MKTNLLKDVLNEGDYAEFREGLRREAEAAARRKRMARTTRWLALAACVALLVGISFFPRRSQQIAIVPTKTSTVSILKTKPLRPEQILVTRATSDLVIATDQSRHVRSISDNELLALFPNHPVGIAETA